MANDSIFAFRPTLWITAILIGSGIVHLAKLAFDGADWNGPLSVRKPVLFGISSGLTTWSVAWVMTHLRPRRYDRWLVNGMAFGLLVEVALITLQFWRGVPSHFNHSTAIDSAIESTMLGLILSVTIGVTHITLRTTQLKNTEPAMAMAIRGGMWLLALSCGMGIATWLLGSQNISLGRPYEYWGQAGVLKFPHGVALHAIQLLPFIVWFGRHCRAANIVRIVQLTFASQLLFLIYSVWQTSQGRSRFNFDVVGGWMLTGTILLAAYPVLSLAANWFSLKRKRLHQKSGAAAGVTEVKSK